MALHSKCRRWQLLPRKFGGPKSLCLHHLWRWWWRPENICPMWGKKYKEINHLKTKYKSSTYPMWLQMMTVPLEAFDPGEPEVTLWVFIQRLILRRWQNLLFRPGILQYVFGIQKKPIKKRASRAKMQSKNRRNILFKIGTGICKTTNVFKAETNRQIKWNHSSYSSRDEIE